MNSNVRIFLAMKVKRLTTVQRRAAPRRSDYHLPYEIPYEMFYGYKTGPAKGS